MNIKLTELIDELRDAAYHRGYLQDYIDRWRVQEDDDSVKQMQKDLNQERKDEEALILSIKNEIEVMERTIEVNRPTTQETIDKVAETLREGFKSFVGMPQTNENILKTYTVTRFYKERRACSYTDVEAFSEAEALEKARAKFPNDRVALSKKYGY